MGHFSKAYEPQGEHWLWVEVLAAALVGSGTDRLIELPWWKPEVDGNSVPFYLAAHNSSDPESPANHYVA